MSRIPIANIYYLFCYAWDRFEEAQSIGLGGIESPDLPNLLAKVLVAGTRTLLRRGIDRGYQPTVEALGTVRGRIELNGSLMLKVQRAPRLVCEFDELSYDVHHNRVLKASLLRLSRAQTLDRHLAHELRLTARRFQGVADIRLRRSDFARVSLHRNNAHYDLVLRIAELAYDCLLPDPLGDGFRFADVLRDERKMAGVFEAFVRNFYRAEQAKFRVEPLQVPWDARPVSVGEGDRLPSMRTDIFLRSKSRQIIIDTKYYAEALQEHRGVESFRSGNLYQLYAYLKHGEAADPTLSGVEGMLLYPQVGRSIAAKYDIQGHGVTIATVDLAAPWREIAARLLSLIERHD